MSGLGRLDLRGDLSSLLAGLALTALALAAASRYGTGATAGTVLLASLFVAAVACFLVAPHVAVAAAIPLFAAVPAMKVFVSPQVGPAKDAVTMAAALAACIYVVSADGRRTLERTDRVVLLCLLGLLTLYAVNSGGLYTDSWHGPQWLQGLRLAAEPLLLLAAGLLLPRPGRTARWAAWSVVAAACAVASYGIFQQVVGSARLVTYGYSYDEQLRTIGSYLRSFGTLDDAFAYATFLLLGLATVIFWMRRGPLAVGCAALISLGILVSFVQTAAVVAGALVALAMIRGGKGTAGLFLLAAAAIAALTLALTSASATETQTVRAGPSTYLTLNGRTSVWSSIFSDREKLPFGLGVGEVGRASDRARIGIADISGSPATSGGGHVAVDSGYFAAVADVGLVGLAVLLLLLGRLVALARRAALATGGAAGWLCLAYLAVLVLDAATRDSFSAFPNAYLGFLLVGVTLAAASADDGQAGAPAATSS